MRSFLEADAHVEDLRDESVGWLYAIEPEPGGTLLGFSRNFDAAIDNLAMCTAEVEPLGKQFLQDVYRRIPWEQMKRRDYDWKVLPPP